MSLFLQKEETKETFLILSIIRLEEDGNVHMHSPRLLVHTRTNILHYCSTEMHIAKGTNLRLHVDVRRESKYMVRRLSIGKVSFMEVTYFIVEYFM